MDYLIWLLDRSVGLVLEAFFKTKIEIGVKGQVYATFFLSFVIGCGMACLNKNMPTDIPKLNKVTKCFGGMVRVFMSIQVYLHYVTMLQVLMLWFGSLSNSC